MKKLKMTLLLTCVLSFLAVNLVSAQQNQKPTVKKSVFFGKTKAIRNAKIVLPGEKPEMKEVEANPLPEFKYDKSLITQERIIPAHAQQQFGTDDARGPILNFEGVGNVNGGWPADPNGDVGMNYYFQTVNSSFAVYDKVGNLQYGPVDYQSIFDAFPGPWHDLSWCDPVIIYDPMADRWAFTTMAHGQIYYEMVAVSMTSDPLGEYYCYAYLFDELNDYPKMSAWTNAYYITYNMFESATTYLHSIVTAVDKEAMLAGDSVVTMIQFTITTPAPNVNRWSPLAADFNGTLLPKNTACPIVLPEYKIAGFPWPVNINFFEMEPDWLVPENSTFDSLTQINVEGTFPFFGANAPQPGNFHDLETINFYLMYPLTYRNFGEYEVMVACQTMYDGEQHFIRWFEFRNDSLGWYIYQSGNYMPDDASRYVPSISINGKGDIAMVFTKSSLDIFPSICFTGRKSGDSLGLMTINELEIYKGLNYVNNYGSQGRNRWGDYASIMVDPENDSTFWFTSMYPLAHTSPGNWSTRITALNLTEETNAPYAYAGNDTAICFNDAFQTEGDASNYSSIIWETDGDGYFLNNNLINTIYVRGNIDIENGKVKLSLAVTGYEPGSIAVDSMMLYLNQLPLVDAGIDDTICAQQSYTCQGEISFSEDHYWTSNGFGTFNDSTLLNAIYTPALNDTAIEKVVLTLHAEPLFPCTEGNEDETHLTIESCLGINEISNYPTLKVYPNPSEGLVMFEANNISSDECVIQVLNSSGQLLFTGSFPCQGSIFNKQFDFSMLPKGIYYFRLITDKKTITAQLIIQ